MKCRVIAPLIALVAAALAAGPAEAVSLSPPSQTAFVYQFLSSTPATSFFPTLLPAGQTSTGHTLESLLKFDLSSVALTPAQVSSATLSLWVVDTTSTGFGASPSSSSPVQVDAFEAAGGWSAATVTWNSTPATLGAASSVSVDGIDKFVSFNVTDIVKDWLGGTTNNGLLLAGNHVVGTPPLNGSPFYIPIFDVGTVHAPQLQINAVPEPASLVLALCAVPGLPWGLRRARHRASR